MKELTRDEIIAQRLANSGLVQPFSSLQQLLSASLGIQSQYLNHGLFNIASRLNLDKNPNISETLESAVLAWGQRQTYHFYEPVNWQKICHFLSDEELWVPSYFESENLDLQKASKDLEKRLEQPRLRSQLVKDFGEESAKLFLWSALFLYHSRQGQLYHKWQEKDRLVLWQKTDSPLSENISKEMLEAYFSFYGPASQADAAHFFGIRQKKIQLADLADLQVFDYEGKKFYAKSGQKEAEIPKILLLGKFDPLLVSYKDKDILIPAERQSEVWKKAGQISALVLIQGRMRGTWTMSVSGKKISFQVVTDKKLSQRQQGKIRRLFKDYAKWTSKVIKDISFDLA